MNKVQSTATNPATMLREFVSSILIHDANEEAPIRDVTIDVDLGGRHREGVLNEFYRPFSIKSEDEETITIVIRRTVKSLPPARMRWSR